MENTQQVVGNLFVSLQLLPQWYQVLGLAGIALLVYFRQNAMVEWLLTNLHAPVGTQYMWYSEYQEPLELLSFVERLGFTFYGVALGAVAYLLVRYVVRRCDAFSQGGLFPESSGKHHFFAVLFLIQAAISLRAIISSSFSDPQSSASLALQALQQQESTNYLFLNNVSLYIPSDSMYEEESLISYSSSFRQHFIIQRCILFNLLKYFCTTHLPVAVVTFLYRAGRDAPRKIFVSLRWYMITYATFLCLIRLFYTVLSGEWGSQSLWVSFCCDAVYVGVVNYTFGSAKRAGMIAHTSYIRCITLAALGTGMCLLMMGVRLIVALAVGVSMHVFELIVIWLLIFLIVVWFPATTDAFATNYMIVLAAVTAYVGYRMEALYTVFGVARYMLLVYVGWVNLSLQYHLWLNLFFSRYVSIAIVIGLVSLLALYVPSPNSELSEWVSAAVDERAALVDSPYLEIYLSLWTQWVMDLCNISQTLVVSSEFIPTRLCASYLKMPDNLVLCTYIVFVVGQVFMIFVTLQTMSVLHRRRMSEARTKKMRSLCIYPITPIVFMIQMVRGVTTLIVAIIFFTSYILLQHTLLPHVSVMAALPTTVKKVVSLLVTCAFIGFLDCAEVIHTSILRALGLCEPPAPDPQNPSDGVEG